MRHGKKFNHLGRKTAHRKAMLANMATSLIMHKRIKTTLAKGKALRKYIEPILTKGKTDTTHSRRAVFKLLQKKEAVKELFGDIADKIGSRPGGYTRIIKTGFRLGDAAEMCIIELVDYNEVMLRTGDEGKKRTRRSGRKRKAKAAAEEPKAETTVEEPKAEDTAVEEPKAEDTAAEEPKAEDTATEEPKADDTATEEPKAEGDKPDGE